LAKLRGAACENADQSKIAGLLSGYGKLPFAETSRRISGSTSAQQQSTQREGSKNMKTQSIHHTKIVPAFLVALAISCLVFSAAAQTGNPSIVGLWRVHYFENGTQVFQSFDQWHSDGQEFEVSNLFGLSCQGVFRQREDGSVKLFHVGWNFDANGNLTGYFQETQIDKVSADNHQYTGTWNLRNFDVNGKFLSEDSGTLRASRLTVN
jgi:hypothetical protein